MKPYCVYKLVFPNGKLYFGITIDFKKRMRSHKHSAIAIKRTPLKNAIKKYGWENIQTIIVKEDISTEQAYKLEKLLIATHNTRDIKHGYNLALGGRTNIGWKLKKDVWNKGKKLSEAHIKALKEAKKGKNYTDVSRKNATIYPVVAFSNVTGEKICFDSAIDCGNYLGVNPSNIYNHIYRNSKLLIKEWTIRRSLNQKEG